MANNDLFPMIKNVVFLRTNILSIVSVYLPNGSNGLACTVRGQDGGRRLTRAQTEVVACVTRAAAMIMINHALREQPDELIDFQLTD